jgi:hypothetical protein
VAAHPVLNSQAASSSWGHYCLSLHLFPLMFDLPACGMLLLLMSLHLFSSPLHLPACPVLLLLLSQPGPRCWSQLQVQVSLHHHHCHSFFPLLQTLY